MDAGTAASKMPPNTTTRLQHLWYEDAVGIPLYQQINIRAYRDWVQGYVPNAMLTDAWEDLKQMVKR
jgi:peptide/nickel transport system substrate-binding protein